MRRWLSSLLPECPARDDVLVVASELGANAVQHTASGQGGSFAVEITWHQQVVRIAVEDCGAAGEPRMIDDPDGDHGRGLLVVERLSARTGVCGDHRGRLVWAEVPWDDAGAGESVSPQARYEAVISEGEAALARRFAGVPAWFGRSTLAWWAVAGPAGLVSAPTAPELAGLLYRLLDSPESAPAPETGQARLYAGGDRRVSQPRRQLRAGAGQEPHGRRPGAASAGPEASGHRRPARIGRPVAVRSLVAAGRHDGPARWLCPQLDDTSKR
jgi:hypothetical protein